MNCAYTASWRGTGVRWLHGKCSAAATCCRSSEWLARLICGVLHVASPNPFYGTAFAAFTNTANQVRIISNNEFVISQGGGIINFATPVPEPETYVLMLAGLLAVGFIARRRTT